MVERPAAASPPGSVVDVIDRDGQWVGRGFYNGHSRISLRILTADPDEPIDDGFFARRIDRAVALRRDWLKLDAVTDAYRLVHSEGDGLSGLVVDRFGDTVVLEFFSAGMFRFRDAIQAALDEHFPGRQVLLVRRGARAEAGVVRLPAAGAAAAGGHHASTASASASPRAASTRPASSSTSATTASSWRRSARGKRVLDLCCNTGGFAVYAKALGGADEVVGRRSRRAGARRWRSRTPG